MKKFSIVALAGVILLVCILINPTNTLADDAQNCPSQDTLVATNFNLTNGLPYTQDLNTVVFHGKSANMSGVRILVDGVVVQPNSAGDVTVNIATGKNTLVVVSIEFTTTVKVGGVDQECKALREYSFSPYKEMAEEPVDAEETEIEKEIGTLPDTSSSIEDLADPTSWIKVSDPTKTNLLSCNYGKTDGKTIKKYTYQSEVKTGVSSCTTTCREDVIVTLDPPVATQSGMCFSYVVDIKTKTTCSSSFTGKKPVKSDFKGCIAPTNCTDGYHEGGPNESFDSCVESCDGGEYTQSCINKCYNEVYTKTSNSKTVKKTKASDKESSISYLNGLKESNSFVTPMKKEKLKTVKISKDKSVTCYTDDYLTKETANLSDAQLMELAKKVYESKKYLPGGYYGSTQKNAWHPTNGTFYIDSSAPNGWRWNWNKDGGGCLSNINYYYFSDVNTTFDTIKMLNGRYPSAYYNNQLYKQYIADNGSLRRARYINLDGSINRESVCPSDCKVSKECYEKIAKDAEGKLNKLVTNAQGYLLYKAELAKYKENKKACTAATVASCQTTDSSFVLKTDETSKNTGNNLGHEYGSNQNVDQAKNGNKSSSTGNFPSMIINTNGVCITGECENTNQEYCSSLDKNSNEYLQYCKDKETCKASGITKCKDGNTCYDYHTTLSFPKNYMNVKTGQTKVEISKDKLPFYVALGNAYCTSLSTKEVNVNWYNYKLDDTNTVAKPDKINKYNITGKINNYGIFGWNFDLSCFFAIKNPTSGTCNGDNCSNCVGSNCSTENKASANNIVSNVKVRSVNLSNLFPNRSPRFNWSDGAKNVNNTNYKVDPDNLIKEIEKTGDSVYDTDKENTYLDYHIKLTKSTIASIRNYNKGKTYNDSEDGMKVNKLSGQGTWGITAYKSKLLDNLGKTVVLKRGLIGCNNQTSSTTCNVEGGN